VRVVAAAAATPPKPINCKETDARWLYYIMYSNNYALEQAQNDDQKEKKIFSAKVFLEQKPNQIKVKELSGKIVLLGGSYRDFDRHFTPLGTTTGVEILANAIQTERSPVPIPVLLSTISPIPPNLISFLMFDVVIGCGILYVLNYLVKIKIIILGFVIFLVLLVIFSHLVIDLVASVKWSVPVVRWLFSCVFAIVPGLVAVIIVVCTEYLRDKFIEMLTETKPRKRYVAYIVVTTEFVRRIFVGTVTDTKARKR
jgi:hypothetical protein